MKNPGFPNVDLYEGNPEGFYVGSWSPTPEADVAAGLPQAPSTQVHLHLMTPVGRGVYRFKGPGSLDDLIGALMKHRIYVWGMPADHRVWISR